MERFNLRNTTSVELFFSLLTSGIEIMPWDQLLYPCVVEICRLGLEPLCDTHLRLCHSENADADQIGISRGVRNVGNHGMRSTGYRVFD